MTANTVPAPPREFLEDHAKADKAIVALHLLRINKKPHEKGVGPNRDDIPMFAELVNHWSKGEGGPKEMVLQARHRVKKYGRQVQASPYYDAIRDPQITREVMCHTGALSIQKHRAEMELAEVLKIHGTESYGDW